MLAGVERSVCRLGVLQVGAEVGRGGSPGVGCVNLLCCCHCTQCSGVSDQSRSSSFEDPGGKFVLRLLLSPGPPPTVLPSNRPPSNGALVLLSFLLYGTTISVSALLQVLFIRRGKENGSLAHRGPLVETFRRSVFRPWRRMLTSGPGLLNVK